MVVSHLNLFFDSVQLPTVFEKLTLVNQGEEDILITKAQMPHLLFPFFSYPDTHDINLHQMWQKEEEKEWGKKTRGKCGGFSGIDEGFLPNSATLDHDKQCYQSRSGWDIVAHGSAPELLA